MDPERARQITRFQALINQGRLHRGMTREEVRAVLGEPTDVGCTSRRYRTPACFKYGEIQLFFGPRSGDGLGLVFSEDADGQEAVTLPWPEGGSDTP